MGSSLACSSNNSANAAPLPPAARPTPPAAFKVSTVAINPAVVNAGVQALITAKITNTGTADDKYRSSVRIDNITKPSLPSFLPSNEVKIAAGETQVVSVTTTINFPGTYQVSWDGVNQTLVVNPEETPLANGAQTTALGSAPDFSATDVVTNKKVSLKDYKGTVVLLNFVNYGCNPSLNDTVSAQLMAIKQLQQTRGDFVPISVFCGCCSPDVLRQFSKQNNFNWPWILDTDYSIATKYSKYLTKYGYPTLIFLDKDQIMNEVAGSTGISALNDKINKIAPVQIKP